MKNIILMGIKHSGKSTIGRILSEQFGYRFMDLDDLVLAESGGQFASVREMIEQEGRENFKLKETNAARNFYKQAKIEKDPVVLALGGGTMENSDTLSRLKEIALLIFIDVPERMLFDRIMKGGKPYFLSADDPLGDFQKLYHFRKEICLRHADIIVNGAEKTADIIAKEIGELVRSLYGR